MADKWRCICEIITILISTIEACRLKQTLNLKDYSIAENGKISVQLFAFSSYIEAKEGSSSFHVVCIKAFKVLQIDIVLGYRTVCRKDFLCQGVCTAKQSSNNRLLIVRDSLNRCRYHAAESSNNLQASKNRQPAIRVHSKNSKGSEQ